MKIGQRIAALREAKGWNQSELAKRAGVTASAINQIESGLTRRPSIETLFPIADALDVDARELAGLPPTADADLAKALSNLIREMPEDRVKDIARYAQYQASQVTRLLASDTFSRYMTLIDRLIDDRNASSTKEDDDGADSVQGVRSKGKP